MPYKIKGNAVVKKSTGKVVGHSKNPKKYMRVLNMIEQGKIPDGYKKEGPKREAAKNHNSKWY